MIAGNLRKITEYLSETFPSHELIVVDDGSEDDTLEALSHLNEILPNLRLLSYRPNRGKGCALRIGAREAAGEWVALVDADLELPIEMLSDFFEVQRLTDAMMVIGSKRHEKSKVVYPRNRVLLSTSFNRLVRFFFNLSLTDTQSGFKLIHNSVLKDIVDPLLVKRYAFDLELLVVESMRGVKVVEAPIRLTFSRPGSGRLNLSAAVSVFRETLGIWYRRFITGYYARSTPQRTTDVKRPIPVVYLDS